MRKPITLAALAATAAIAIAAMTTLPTPVQAREIAWCARTRSNGFNGDCMYYTYAQCQAAISGLRGECVRNPFASYSYGAERPRRRHRSHVE